jgi:hypothetical protein
MPAANFIDDLTYAYRLLPLFARERIIKEVLSSLSPTAKAILERSQQDEIKSDDNASPDTPAIDDSGDLLCIIGANTGSGSPYPRQWFTDDAGAIDYGKELVGKNRLTRAYVVRVVKIIEKTSPPIEVRDPHGLSDVPEKLKGNSYDRE